MLPDDVLLASLHQHTEGWPVGIRLAALALRSQSDYGEFAAHLRMPGAGTLAIIWWTRCWTINHCRFSAF